MKLKPRGLSGESEQPSDVQISVDGDCALRAASKVAMVSVNKRISVVVSRSVGRGTSVGRASVRLGSDSARRCVNCISTGLEGALRKVRVLSVESDDEVTAVRTVGRSEQIEVGEAAQYQCFKSLSKVGEKYFVCTSDSRMSHQCYSPSYPHTLHHWHFICSRIILRARLL